MENENNKNFFDTLKKEWENDLRFSEEENRKQLENYKRELEEIIRKRLEELEKREKEILEQIKGFAEENKKKLEENLIEERKKISQELEKKKEEIISLLRQTEDSKKILEKEWLQKIEAKFKKIYLLFGIVVAFILLLLVGMFFYLRSSR